LKTFFKDFLVNDITGLKVLMFDEAFTEAFGFTEKVYTPTEAFGFYRRFP
jgi:hypothetical protein